MNLSVEVAFARVRLRGRGSVLTAVERALYAQSPVGRQRQKRQPVRSQHRALLWLLNKLLPPHRSIVICMALLSLGGRALLQSRENFFSLLSL